MSDSNVIDLTKITSDDLEELRKRNVQKLQAIRQQGADLDTVGITAKRFDVLVDLLLNKEQRIQFEYAFETTMTELLDSALAQLRTAKLTQGVQQAVNRPSSLILP
jgi:hypothetical protein